MLLIYVFRSVCFLFIDLNYSLFRVDSGAAVDSYSDIKKNKTHHCRVRRVMSLDICLKYNSVEAIYFLAHSLFVRENNMSLTLNIELESDFLTESYAKFQQDVGKFQPTPPQVVFSQVC